MQMQLWALAHPHNPAPFLITRVLPIYEEVEKVSDAEKVSDSDNLFWTQGTKTLISKITVKLLDTKTSA